MEWLNTFCDGKAFWPCGTYIMLRRLTVERHVTTYILIP